MAYMNSVDFVDNFILVFFGATVGLAGVRHMKWPKEIILFIAQHLQVPSKQYETRLKLHDSQMRRSSDDYVFKAVKEEFWYPRRRRKTPYLRFCLKFTDPVWKFSDFKFSSRSPYYLIDGSVWPFYVSFFLFWTIYFFVEFLHGYQENLLNVVIFLIIVLFCVFSWANELNYESTKFRLHTSFVTKNLILGFYLFLASETMVFFGLFWSFFHFSLSPSIFIGGIWPPHGIKPFSTSINELPFVNTYILLLSGLAITEAHKAFYERYLTVDHHELNPHLFVYETNERKAMLKCAARYIIDIFTWWLTITIFIGGWFLHSQFIEYYSAPFSINDSVYGSIFFFITGCHGSHVLVGLLLLSFVVIKTVQPSPIKEFSIRSLGITFWCISIIRPIRLEYVWFPLSAIIESSIIYWHFVDIVWLFVFSIIYGWGA